MAAGWEFGVFNANLSARWRLAENSRPDLYKKSMLNRRTDPATEEQGMLKLKAEVEGEGEVEVAGGRAGWQSGVLRNLELQITQTIQDIDPASRVAEARSDSVRARFP
jgi:hypothetical protein